MNNSIYKAFVMGLVFLVSGCTLSLPDFGSEDNLELEPYSYKRVLDNNYDGYEDDDDISSAEIDEGAEDFAQCSDATECALLWDTAKKWLTEKSTYKSTLKTDTNNLIETAINPRKKKADKITFKVIKIPNGKTNIIKISADCPKNCNSFIDKEYFAFNSYLKNHLAAYRNDIIGFAIADNKEFIASNKQTDELDIDFDDVSSKPQESVLKENLLENKIEITKKRKKVYIGKVAEKLMDEDSCHKATEINLVKKTKKRELYEVNCIKEIKRMIFDCSPSGCEVLQ